MVPPSFRLPAVNSVRRLFAVYAAVSLVPVLLLGSALLLLLNSLGGDRGLAEGRAKADLIARASIAPALDGQDLRQPLSSRERAELSSRIALAVAGRDVLRLRVRNLDGVVVASDDSSGGGADDESLAAATGRTVSKLTWLNADSNDSGPRGPRVVEIYQPLAAARSGQRIGVLEVYLPYAPIAADISRGQREVTSALGVGLGLLWLSMLAVSTSVTRRLRRQAAANAFLASHDSLTGMPNRARFAEQAKLAIAQSNPTRQAAVVLVDLDRFKDVNDTLGHTNGDQLLVALADRLAAHVREGDTLARLGGDEFGIVLRDLYSTGEAVETINRLRGVLAAPLQINGLPLAIEASAGFALAPTDETRFDALLQQADVAMYFAKRQRLGVVHYRPEQDQYDSSALTLVAELGAAIEAGQLVLHYQPKGDVRSAPLPRWRPWFAGSIRASVCCTRMRSCPPLSRPS